MIASAVVDIRSTYGIAMIGLFVSSILFGMTIIQAWTYHWVYRRRDPLSLQVFIAILFLLDCLHTILCFHALYWYLILNFGNVDNLQFNMWSMNTQGAISVSICFLVQLCYARRVYILSGKIIFPLVIVGAASIWLVCGSVYVAKEFALKRYSLYGALTLVTCVASGSAVLADTLIALSMCWLLYCKKTGFARTDSTAMTLMSYTISTGFLTSFICIGMVISFATAPTSMLPEAFYWTLTKCHMNALLAMLNSRNPILERSDDLHPRNTFYMASFGMTQQKDTTLESASQQAAISVSGPQSTTMDFSSSKHDYNTMPESAA